MAKFVVDRRTWYRGKGSDESQLLLGNGQRCCIGFVGAQVGCLDSDLMGEAEISCLDGEYAELFPAWMYRDKQYREGNARSFIQDAYLTNDDESLTEAEREEKLKDIFAQNGDEIVFEN